MHGLTGGSWKRSHDHRASFLPYSAATHQQVVAGRYDLALRCVNTFNQEFRRFTTAIFFTDPTHYQATPTIGRPVPTVTPTGSATTTTTPATRSIASSEPPANTGAPIALTFLGGLILLAAGLVLVVWLRRREGRP